MSLSERQREGYEKVLLADTLDKKVEVLEKEFGARGDAKYLKFWYMMAKGNPKKDWQASEKKEFENWYGHEKANLENIDLLLRFDQAKDDK